MPDNQAPQNQAPEIRSHTLSAPPGLRLIAPDAAAGVCADGHCALPATVSRGADEDESRRAGARAETSDAD